MVERALGFDAEHPVLRPDPHRRRVLQERDAGEVKRLLHLERIALECANLCAAREGGCKPSRDEDRRVDPAGEDSYPVERRTRLPFELLQQRASTRRIAVEQLECQLQRARDRGEILLNAVVQRTFDPSALAVEVGGHPEIRADGPAPRQGGPASLSIAGVARVAIAPAAGL